MSPDPLDFNEGTRVWLTRRQRRFIAKKVLKALDKARDNRDRIEAKYDAPAIGQEQVIHSLVGLGIKLGLTDDDLADTDIDD